MCSDIIPNNEIEDNLYHPNVIYMHILDALRLRYIKRLPRKYKKKLKRCYSHSNLLA